MSLRPPVAPARARPVFLDPLKVRLPVPATVSLAHRVSGLLLLAAAPAAVALLERSLRDAQGFAAIWRLLSGPVAAALALLLAWALAHHVAAGVRHLLFDAGIGTTLAAARRSAWIVHAVALGATLLFAAALAWPARG